MSKKDKKEKEEKSAEGEVTYQKGAVRELAEVLLYGLALLMFFRIYVFQNFQIPTSSMENTLLIGDHITANMFVFKNSSELDKKILPFREIRRGDVVVFKFPGEETQDWIKRCIALPGDRFQMIQDRVYINGEPLNEPYPFYKQERGPGDNDRDPNNRYYPLDYGIEPGLDNADPMFLQERTVTMEQIRAMTKRTLIERYRRRDGMNPDFLNGVLERLQASPPETIPEGFYMMVGDNRNNSYDSTRWGLVPQELIEGRAWLIWWSYGEDVGSHQLKGKDLIMSYLRVPITFWTRTHWEKCFDLIK